MTTLGPNDPRAITGKALEEARKNTEKWNEMLGIKPMTAKQKARYEQELEQVLDIIGWKDDDDTGCGNTTLPIE
jgi:hypothetical protein